MKRKKVWEEYSVIATKSIIYRPHEILLKPNEQLVMTVYEIPPKH